MNDSKKYRTILIYKHYFKEFFARQKQKVKDKITWTFTLIEELPRVPEQSLKHLEGTDSIYEIRIRRETTFSESFVFFMKAN